VFPLRYELNPHIYNINIYIYIYIFIYLYITYHVWRRGEMHTGFWWGKPEIGNNFEDPSVTGRIILKWIFEKWDGRHGLNRSGAGYGQVVVIAVMNIRFL
jgi:hypothetical protein